MSCEKMLSYSYIKDERTRVIIKPHKVIDIVISFSFPPFKLKINVKIRKVCACIVINENGMST